MGIRRGWLCGPKFPRHFRCRTRNLPRGQRRLRAARVTGFWSAWWIGKYRRELTGAFTTAPRGSIRTAAKFSCTTKFTLATILRILAVRRVVCICEENYFGRRKFHAWHGKEKWEQLPDGRRFGVYICYEAVFPSEVRQFTANDAELLVTISNDGWFGRTDAPEQHLDMARLRAIENRRWMIRSTNNGYTVSVDPYGREVASIPTDIRGSLNAPYAYRDDMTLYARRGDWLPWLSLLAGLGFVIMGYTVRKKPA